MTGAPLASSWSTSESLPWLRRWVAAVVGVLTLITVVTAFADEMPASHHVAVPIAAAIMAAAWAIELSGKRWPRLALIAATVVPNIWLTFIHHGSANLLFLLLLVAWVGFLGSRVDSLVALGLSLATMGAAVSLDGQIAWSALLSFWAVLLMAWLMALVLRSQQRLVRQLSLARSVAEQGSLEMETLLSVSQSVASTLDMKPLLDAVLDALGSVVDYSGTAILSLDEARDALTFTHMRGPTSFTWDQARRISYRVEDFHPFWQRLCTEEAIVVSDIRGDSPEAAAFRRMVGEDQIESTYGFIGSVMWIPLVVRGRMTGILSIANSAPRAYGPHDATLALGIARQAAVAIENARLHERARHTAVLEERQRLARELHDSVTQALYGVSLYAEAAGRALADGDLQPAAANLREIGATTQEALAEMRLLLFDLRPPLLVEQGLAGALQSRLQAVEARAGLSTTFEGAGAERLGPETEQELYRLAQEALNNVLKHAHAARIAVRLDVSPDFVCLEIADDGVGFDPTLRGGNGYGLPGMRERAERLGGCLEVDSAAGAGTRVRVKVPR